jgi:hypothetical protein
MERTLQKLTFKVHIGFSGHQIPIFTYPGCDDLHSVKCVSTQNERVCLFLLKEQRTVRGGSEGLDKVWHYFEGCGWLSVKAF